MSRSVPVRNELHQAPVGIAEVDARPVSSGTVALGWANLDRDAVALQVLCSVLDSAIPLKARSLLPGATGILATADADCVMLYRDDYYDRDSDRPGELDIIVRKNRQGKLGQVATRIDDRLRHHQILRVEVGDARAVLIGAGVAGQPIAARRYSSLMRLGSSGV